MKEIKYTCRYCGKANTITTFWKWFWTPHFGSRKWIKCKHCEAKRHFMKRQDWNKPWWFDWYK